MVWKQDLAKLKQALGPNAEAPAPKPVPKPLPKPATPTNLEDEDAVFLSAMGLKPARPPKPKAAEPAAPAPAPKPAPPVETFADALKDLKGVKPLSKGPAAEAVKPVTTRPIAKATPAPLPKKSLPPLPPPPPDPAPMGPLPQRFQLAAGMAIEVDATLDLRGHTVANALDRLQDRLGDGLALGWRSLLVTLGPDPALHQGLLDLLASGQTPVVSRYAQAPVPMGGTQAWLLYFSSPTP